MLPLEGITVVSIEQAVSAPFATRQLADLGARVIKIERPGTGDFARHYDQAVLGMSSHFVWINRSKESLVLDLKQEKSKAVLDKILSRADVFVHNLAPGAIGRLGFAASVLKEKYPRLINCSISGYGSSGPYKDKKAYDLIIQCETGVVSLTGTEDTPSKSGVPVGDIAAGMYAYSGILTALISRMKTGKGEVLEVSMLEALGEWVSFPIYYSLYGGSEPKRTGASHSTIFPYGPFATGDGKSVFLSVQNEREWTGFCRHVLGKPELAVDSRFSTSASRLANSGELAAVIDAIFQKIDAETIISRLETAGIANAHLNTIREFICHPQLAARQRITEVGSPVGKLKALIPPVTFESIEPVMNPIPALGEHTQSILKEFGFDQDQNVIGEGDA